jgi:NhaA family Na+:H+ antiporter
VRHEIAQLDGSASQVSSHDLADHLRHVDIARREAISPAESLIHALHPWVAFGIMPVFALANAGVVFDGASEEPASALVLVAVAAGLLVGKPLGILLFTWAGLRLGLTKPPAGITGRHLVVLGLVAGVGFTMSLFIAQLAFGDSQLLAPAKLGVLTGSATAGVAALLLGRILLPTSSVEGVAPTADAAEASTEP